MVALKTFTNLPIERQEEIILASLEEFALHEYQTASLSNIVASLGIAKGSFYRYFDSKSSLYMFLFDYCFQKRLEYNNKQQNPEAEDFFEALTFNIMARVQFDINFPLHSAFLHKTSFEKDNEELGNINKKTRDSIHKAIKPFLLSQIAKKQLQKDIDLDFLTFTISQLNYSIIQYISYKYDIDVRENIKNRKTAYQLSKKDLTKVIGQFIEVLKSGIVNKK